MRHLFLFSLVATLALPSFAAWGKGGPWNDGRAEVAVYDSERIVDGKPRVFKEHLITSKEEWKQDNQKPARVFKFNQIQKFDLENFPVNNVTTIFFREETPAQVFKLTSVSQDWSGNNIFSWNFGESVPLTVGPNDYFEDQLPFSLRSLPFKEGYEQKIRLWSEVANKGTPTVSEAVLQVGEKDTIRSRVSIPCWVVTITRPTGKDTYWFEAKEPNILVKMETSDGRKRSLYGRARWSYWDKRLPRPNILN